MVVFRQMNIPQDEKLGSHNKAMDRGLKPATVKPGRTNNTFSYSIFDLHIEIILIKFVRNLVRLKF